MVRSTWSVKHVEKYKCTCPVILKKVLFNVSTERWNKLLSLHKLISCVVHIQADHQGVVLLGFLTCYILE